MRKLASVCVAALLALSTIALAGESGDRTVVGTVSFVDAASKSMVVKDATGNNVTVYWNDATKVEPSIPQEGASVTVMLDGKDQGSRPMAKSISVQQPKKPY